MGRLPLSFGGQPIKLRIPFNLPGELIVAAPVAPVAVVNAQFPIAVFSAQVDKPFEIHRMFCQLTGIDGAGAVQAAQPPVLDRMTRLYIHDRGKNEAWTAIPQMVSTMVDALSRTWEFDEPWTMQRNEGFTVTVDNVAPAAVSASTRVEVNFQGFMIQVAPPSETR